MPSTRERRILISAAILAVALPALAQRYASHRLHADLEPALSEKLGERVTIGAVATGLDGSLRLEDVRLGDIAYAEAVEASIGLGSLLAGDARPDEIRITAPRVRVIAEPDGRTNLERLAARVSALRARTAAKPSVPGDSSSARAPRLRRVIVNGGDLVVDLGDRGSLRLRAVEAHPRAGGVRLLVGGAELDARVGPVRLRGQLGRLAADLRLRDLTLTRALAVGGNLELGGEQTPARLHDVVFAHRTDARGDTRMIARVHRPGTDGRLSVRVPRSRDRASIEMVDVPIAALSSLLSPSLRLEDAQLTGRAAVRQDLDGTSVAFDGSVHRISVDDPRVAAQPVTVDMDLAVALRHREDSLELTDVQLNMGAIGVNASGRIDGHGRNATGRLEVELVRADCAQVLASLPAPMRASLGGLRASGTVAAHLDLDFSRHDERATRLEVDMDLGRCKIGNEPAASDPRRLRTAFEHRFPNGTQVVVGENHGDYAALSSMPRYLPKAWVAAEDAAFFRHHGFDLRQIERSLAVDLRAGAFVRGGSTISQQLVKNVFLSHERSLARKLQEAVLTWRLESRLGKRMILERYLNIIELGPGVYGVPAAARYWFDKPTRKLSVAETAFLVALTPEPQSASRRIRAQGKLDPDTAQRMRVILRHMRRRGVISENAYARAKRHPPELDLTKLAQR